MQKSDQYLNLKNNSESDNYYYKSFTNNMIKYQELVTIEYIIF